MAISKSMMIRKFLTVLVSLLMAAMAVVGGEYALISVGRPIFYAIKGQALTIWCYQSGGSMIQGYRVLPDTGQCSLYPTDHTNTCEGADSWNTSSAPIGPSDNWLYLRNTCIRKHDQGDYFCKSANGNPGNFTIKVFEVTGDELNLATVGGESTIVWGIPLHLNSSDIQIVKDGERIQLSKHRTLSNSISDDGTQVLYKLELHNIGPDDSGLYDCVLTQAWYEKCDADSIECLNKPTKVIPKVSRKLVVQDTKVVPTNGSTVTHLLTLYGENATSEVTVSTRETTSSWEPFNGSRTELYRDAVTFVLPNLERSDDFKVTGIIQWNDFNQTFHFPPQAIDPHGITTPTVHVTSPVKTGTPQTASHDGHELSMDTLYWSSLPGLPSKMKWPVQVISWTQRPLVYCNADDAYFNVSLSQLVSFGKSNSLDIYKNKARVALKKRPKTLVAFSTDVEWALAFESSPKAESNPKQVKGTSEGLMTENRVGDEQAEEEEDEQKEEDKQTEEEGGEQTEEVGDEQTPDEASMSPKSDYDYKESADDNAAMADHIDYDEQTEEDEDEQTEEEEEQTEEEDEQTEDEDEQTEEEEEEENEQTEEEEGDEQTKEVGDEQTKEVGDEQTPDEASMSPISDYDYKVSADDNAAMADHIDYDEQTEEDEDEQTKEEEEQTEEEDEQTEEEEEGDEQTEEVGDELTPDEASMSSISDYDYKESADDNAAMADHIDYDDDMADPDYVMSDGSDESVIYPQLQDHMEVECADSSDGEETAPDFPFLSSDKVMKDVDIILDEEERQDFLMDDTPWTPHSRVLDKNDKVFCVRNGSVFIKKRQTANEKSKSGRFYDIVHACQYCGSLMTNVTTHFMGQHRNEDGVKYIMKMKEELETATNERCQTLKSDIKREQKLMKNKGDHKHNQQVMMKKEGELLVCRRRKGTFDSEDYGPCPECFEWMVLADNYTKHRSSCVRNTQCSAAIAIVQSYVFKGKIAEGTCEKMKTEVFPSMMKDEITSVAVKDPLIVALGEWHFMNNLGNKIKRKNYSSYRMRLSARMLQIVQEELKSPSATLSECLVVENFDLFAKAALMACGKTLEDELKHPSVALKIGYDLVRLAAAKMALYSKKRDEVNRKEAKRFAYLLEKEWKVKVRRQAKILLEERSFNKHSNLPHPEDIANLASYIIRELREIELDPLPSVFRRTVILTEARLLLYNRRRPGELEALLIAWYKRRQQGISETDLSLREELTKMEIYLLKSQELVEIRGKTGTRVPVLLPSEVKKPLQFLADDNVRLAVGIKKSNKYLFASSGDEPVRAGNALDIVKYEAELKFPNRILATNLRKHTATISQVMGLEDHQLKWLTNHMGHTEKVHLTHYRATSGLIERLDVAKVMLLQERNNVAKFAGLKLADIQFHDLDGEEHNPEPVCVIDAEDHGGFEMEVEEVATSAKVKAKKKPESIGLVAGLLVALVLLGVAAAAVAFLIYRKGWYKKWKCCCCCAKVVPDPDASELKNLNETVDSTKSEPETGDPGEHLEEQEAKTQGENITQGETKSLSNSEEAREDDDDDSLSSATVDVEKSEEDEEKKALNGNSENQRRMSHGEEIGTGASGAATGGLTGFMRQIGSGVSSAASRMAWWKNRN